MRNATPLNANAIKIVTSKKRIEVILLVDTPTVFPKFLLTFFPIVLLCFPKLFIYKLEILYYEINIENQPIILYPGEMSSTSSNVETSTSQVRLLGIVKWFNNKRGFGFITIIEDGDHKNKDIFVHYSSIRVTNSQYKYLEKGEYVEFDFVHTTDPAAEHEFYADAISGIKGGPLKCETVHNENLRRPPQQYVQRLPKTDYVPRDDRDREYRPRRSYRDDRPQQDGRRSEQSHVSRPQPDSEGFVRVERRRSSARA
jgi:cold shock CspA family protein